MANDYNLDDIICISDQKDVIGISVCECTQKQLWIELDFLKSLSELSVC